MRQKSIFKRPNLFSTITLSAVLGLGLWPVFSLAADYTLISPTAIVAGPNGRVAGVQDVAPKMKKISTNRVVRGTLPSATITVSGSNFSPDDTFKLNRHPLGRRFLSTRKIVLTIPVSRLAYKSYALRLIHQGQEVSTKTLTVVRRK